MRRRVDHADLAAAGYFSDWSLLAGEVAAFHLSTSDAAASARVVRLDRTKRPGVDWDIRRAPVPLEVQTLDLGASITLEIDDGFCAADEWTLGFEFRLTVEPRDRVLLCAGGIALRFDAHGALSLAGGTSTAPGAPLPAGLWLAGQVQMNAGLVDATVRRWGSDTILFHANGHVLPPHRRRSTLHAHETKRCRR
jgi:hypothetical protein